MKRSRSREKGVGVYIDNVRLAIDWNRWELGQSIFVPCVDPDTLIQQMRRRAKHHKYVLTAKECVERGLFGVRFWRTT